MRCFPNIAMVLVYLFLTSLPITIYATQSITSNERITTASGVKLRNLPQSKAQEVTRLRLGTVVTVVGTSTSKEKIGTSEDFWYSVKTADGKTGWLFGSFTAPFDASKREQTYLKLAQDRLKLENKTFGDLVDLHAFLTQAVTEVKTINIVAELDFLRLQVLEDSLSTIPYEDEKNNPYSIWIKNNEKDIYNDELVSSWFVKPERFKELAKKYHGLPITQRLIWAAFESEPKNKCELDLFCWVDTTIPIYVGYLKLYPNGENATEALNSVLYSLKFMNDELKQRDSYFNNVTDEKGLKLKQELKNKILKLRKTLIDELVIPRKAELATQLDQLIKALG